MSAEIPDAVAALCRFSSPHEVEATEASCFVRTNGLELRFYLNTDGSWDFDEVVGHAFVHIEQLSDASYWIGLTTDEGHLSVDIGSVSGRARVSMRGEAW